MAKHFVMTPAEKKIMDILMVFDRLHEYPYRVINGSYWGRQSMRIKSDSKKDMVVGGILSRMVKKGWLNKKRVHVQSTYEKNKFVFENVWEPTELGILLYAQELQHGWEQTWTPDEETAKPARRVRGSSTGMGLAGSRGERRASNDGVQTAGDTQSQADGEGTATPKQDRRAVDYHTPMKAFRARMRRF
jgi:hypothetical protein